MDGGGFRGVQSDDTSDCTRFDVVLFQVLAVVAAAAGGVRFVHYPIARVGWGLGLGAVGGLGLGLGFGFSLVAFVLGLELMVVVVVVVFTKMRAGKSETMRAVQTDVEKLCKE